MARRKGSIRTPSRKYRGGFYVVAEVDKYGLVLKRHGSWLHKRVAEQIKKEAKPIKGGRIKTIRII